MGRMKELYPDAPGWTEPTTSRDAALRIAPRAGHLRSRSLLALQHAGQDGLTADEIAQRIGSTILSVRPRIAELGVEGRIERTGKRRPTSSGAMAAVWRIKK